MSKILVVDDSEAARKEVCDYLEDAGHTTIVAANGSLGLKTFKEEPGIELVISDLNMPVMDGITMSEEISKLPKTKVIPIVMVTTDSDRAMKDRGKKAGVVVWVIKPIKPLVFTDVVGKIIEKFRS